MKPIILFIALITSLTTYAQVGLKGGVNFANLHYKANNQSENGERLLAFHVGLFFDKENTKTFSIQPEILFSMQGNEIATPTGNIKEQLGYFIFPILFKYQAVEQMALYAGPQVGLLVFGNEINGAKVKDYYKPIDLSLSAGIEFMASEKVRVGGRYNLGLSNIDDFDDSGELKIKHRVGQIYLGFMF